MLVLVRLELSHRAEDRPYEEMAVERSNALDSATANTEATVEGEGRRVIYFSTVRDKTYGVFSNMAPAVFHVNGKKYRTVEHFYHSEKFRLAAEATGNETTKKSLLDLATKIQVGSREDGLVGGLQAKEFVREHEKELPHGFLKEKWEGQLAVDVMRKGLRAKFTEDREWNWELLWRLLATGDAYLVQKSEVCRQWGWHPSSGGGNALGRLLMELRDEGQRLLERERQMNRC